MYVKNNFFVSMIIVTACCFLLMISSLNIQRKTNTSALQEKFQDDLELLDMEKNIERRNKWMYDNIAIFDYDTNTLRTLSSSDGEIQIKMEPLPGVSLEHDNLTVDCNHSLITSFTKEDLDVHRIDDYTWRFNVSVDDSTEHTFVFNNGTQSEYVLYVTEELNPIDDSYFMPVQWEFMINTSS